MRKRHINPSLRVGLRRNLDTWKLWRSQNVNYWFSFFFFFCRFAPILTDSPTGFVAPWFDCKLLACLPQTLVCLRFARSPQNPLWQILANYGIFTSLTFRPWLIRPFFWLKTNILPSPFISKLTNVLLALHHTNFAFEEPRSTQLG